LESISSHLNKGGVPDLEGSARAVLRDWVSGRIPFYSVAPPVNPAFTKTQLPNPGVEDEASLSANTNPSVLVEGFSKEFDIEALFGKADEEAFNNLQTKEEMKGLVRMESGGVEDEEVNEVKLSWVGERNFEDEESEEEEDVP
jgi:nuclear GTP-binding protein